MSDQLYNLTSVQMGAATTLMCIGLLAACLLTMGQWLIHRRRLATVFLFSVVILLAFYICLLYTSPSPRDAHESRMPSSA